MKSPLPLLLLFIFVSLFSFSCATGKEYRSLVIYREPPVEASIFLHSLQLEPPYAAQYLRELLPEVLRSMLTRHGVAWSENAEEGALFLELYLRRGEYQRDMKKYESLTLTLTLTDDAGPIAFVLYTRDTRETLDSFPFVYSMLEVTISRLAEALESKKPKEGTE